MRRLLLLPVVVLMLSIFVFGLVRSVPGDVVAAKLENSYSQAQADELLAQYGLDKPVVEQYFTWLGRVFQGDFGRSFVTNREISEDLSQRLPTTLELLFLVTLMQVPLGIGLGIVSAMYQDRLSDYAIRFLSIVLLAIPSFWLATLVIILPSIWWQWSLPIGYSKLWDDPDRNLYQLSIPAALAAFSSAAVVMRVTRSQMLEVIRADYVRTARAKGLRERSVIYRHALKNALIPVVTVIGLTVGAGFSGLVIMEQVFSIPGIGSYTVAALASRDYPVIQAVVLIIGIAFTLVTLAVDLSYVWLDPRVRFR